MNFSNIENVTRRSLATIYSREGKCPVGANTPPLGGGVFDLFVAQ